MPPAWSTWIVAIGLTAATLRAQDAAIAPPATVPSGPFVTQDYDLKGLMVLAYSAANEPDLIFNSVPATMPANVSESQARRVRLAISAFLTGLDPDGVAPEIEQVGLTLRITHTARSHERLRAELRNRAIRIGIDARFISTSKVLNDWFRTHGGENGTRWQASGDLELWPYFPDRSEIERLLGFIQDDPGAATVAAPRLTLFNEQEANVTVSTETAHVESLTPIFGVNAVAFDPHVGVFSSGVTLRSGVSITGNGGESIEIAISAKLSRLLEMQPVPVSMFGGDELVTAYYQVPVASIADGGTVFKLPAGRGAILRMIPKVTPPDAGRPPEQPVFLLIHPMILTPKEQP